MRAFNVAPNCSQTDDVSIAHRGDITGTALDALPRAFNFGRSFFLPLSFSKKAATSHCERSLGSEFFCHRLTFEEASPPRGLAGDPERERNRLCASVKLGTGFPIKTFGNDKIWFLWARRFLPDFVGQVRRIPSERPLETGLDQKCVAVNALVLGWASEVTLGDVLRNRLLDSLQNCSRYRPKCCKFNLVHAETLAKYGSPGCNKRGLRDV